jgi:hypothetical protein
LRRQLQHDGVDDDTEESKFAHESRTGGDTFTVHDVGAGVAEEVVDETDRRRRPRTHRGVDGVDLVREVVHGLMAQHEEKETTRERSENEQKNLDSTQESHQGTSKS